MKITQYMQDVWTTDNGLPQNSVYAIVQTRDGYLWLGTAEGLVRFDGVQFTVYDKKNTPELKQNYVRALLEDRDGSLWIGTNGGGLDRLKEGTFISYTTKDGLSSDNVRTLYQDGEGSLWIGTGAGLSHLKDGKFTSYTTQDGLSNDNVRAILQDSDRSLWIGTGGGLNHLKKGKFTSYTTQDGLSNDNVWTLYQDSEGSLWIGTGGGLNRLKNGTFTSYTTKDGHSNDNVNVLYQDRHGTVWIGTYGGGLNRRLMDGTYTSFTTKDGLSNDNVLAIQEDREGSLWIGTQSGGLNRFKDGKFTSYTTRDGLSNDIVASLYQDREGIVWIGTNGGGLNRLKNGTFTSYTTKNGLSNDVVGALYQDREGSLWIGTDGGGLNRLKDGKFSSYTTKDGLSNDFIGALYQDSEGSLWVGTFGGGLDRLKDGRFTSYSTKEGLSNNSVYVLYEDRKANLWIGTNGGLDRLKGGKFTSYSTKDGLSNERVSALYEDRQANLWIGTLGGGLNRLKDGKITSYTSKEGLFDDRVFMILEDSNGNLWMSCNKGIYRVSKRELDDFDAGRAKRIHSISYGKPDGMKSQECNGGGPGGWKTADGKFLFATIKGVAVIDPEHIRINEALPPVIVEDLIAGGSPFWASVALPGSHPSAFGSSARLEIPPDSNKLEFHYTALSFLIPERVQFKYKLDGFDKDWVEPGGSNRIATYTNVPPGHYTFRVKACNNDGIWNESGASFAFYLLPHFYQTHWFYGICFLAAVATIIAGHQARVRHLKEREKELTRVVEEKTKDLRAANEKIDKLMRSAPQALDNLSAWSKAAAEDIARTIGVTEISIWALENEELKLISGSGAKPPSLSDLRTNARLTNKVVDSTEAIVPLVGLRGELYGGLTISGSGTALGESQGRLIAGFAHQLGGTLETQHMARRLAQAEERKALKRQEMQDQGIPTLEVCPKCGRCYDNTAESCEADGTKLQSPRTLPYRILDRYRLIRMLGEGGMGAVFQAYDEKLNRSVAVKIIKAELLVDPSMRLRLEREAHLVARIQHPGVVAIHDFGEIADGSNFIVMELLQGVNLATVLKFQGPGTPAQVAALLMQIGEALEAAHSQGIIHRDLKPANLFLIPSEIEFTVKVLDFGLAKSFDDQTSLTLSGAIVGSPSYMSPEQVRNEPLDERSDLFTLASVTYELLTGRVAFEGEFLTDVLGKVLTMDPPPLSSSLSGAHPDLDRIFGEALEKDPDRRPPTVKLWVERIAPLLVKTDSRIPGWNPAALNKESPGIVSPFGVKTDYP